MNSQLEVIGGDTVTGLRPEHEAMLIILANGAGQARDVALQLRARGYEGWTGIRVGQVMNGFRELGLIKKGDRNGSGAWSWELTEKGEAWAAQVREM